MPLATRHRADATPVLPPLAGFQVTREHDADAMAALQARTTPEMRRRFDDGHRAYVGSLHGAPAAWGWVATRSAHIGEMGATFTISGRARYLWNFVTLPSFRGLGIYPRLIEAIVRAESVEAERFWIAYAPENHASGAGIRKAGFVTVAELSFDAAGRAALKGLTPGGGRVASRVFGVPEVTEELAPCWRCVRAGRGSMSCAPGQCRCDYQVQHSGCAA